MILPSDQTEGKAELGMEILVAKDETAVYVKLTGFEDLEDADSYAEFLQKNLPFLLFESGIQH